MTWRWSRRGCRNETRDMAHDADGLSLSDAEDVTHKYAGVANVIQTNIVLFFTILLRYVIYKSIDLSIFLQKLLASHS